MACRATVQKHSTTLHCLANPLVVISSRLSCKTRELSPALPSHPITFLLRSSSFLWPMTARSPFTPVRFLLPPLFCLSISRSIDLWLGHQYECAGAALGGISSSQSASGVGESNQDCQTASMAAMQVLLLGGANSKCSQFAAMQEHQCGAEPPKAIRNSRD